MTTGSEDQTALEALERKIRTILPEEYQDNYDDVQPVSMGSAGLKYDGDKVAWDEIWGSFCDLAMAGGPPHKGRLLEPGSQAEIEAQPDRYGEVVAEICRGVAMVTGLVADPSESPGWVRVGCDTYGMAEWLVRAIVMENVSARCEDSILEIPAGPGYRLEKEIKNVITSVAKTCHYWQSHMWYAQHREIETLFVEMWKEWPLVQPSSTGDDGLRDRIADAIHLATGLKQSNHSYRGWLGLECPDVHSAIWMMRAIVVGNVLARREESTLFVPVNAATDPDGNIVIRAVIQAHNFAKVRGIC